MPKRATPEPPVDESAPTESATTEIGPPHTHRFFTWIRSLGLVRQPGWIGGVSAGIASRLGIDVLVVRGILVVVALLGGPAVLLYAIAWLVLPDTTGRIHLESLVHGRIETPVIGIAILIALSLLPVSQGFWWLGSQYWGSPRWGDSTGRAVWTLVILGLLVWFVVWFARHRSRRAGTTDSVTAPPTAGSATPVADPPLGNAGAVAFTGEPGAPVAPSANASTDELAAWRTRQEQWRVDHEAYRAQQEAERRSAARAVADAAQAERAARAAAARERQRATRSHPLYSLALIGTALLAGAVTTLAVGVGDPTPAQWLLGDAVALGVLGIGIILNGALGRRSGGATGVAILLGIVLLVPAIFPQNSTRHYFGAVTLTPHALGSTGGSATYLQGIGAVRVDLASYYATPRPKFTKDGGLQSYNQVNILVAAGDVTVVLPPDEYEYIEAGTAGGRITTPNGARVDGAWDKSLLLPGDPKGEREARVLDVEIHVLQGNITFIEQGADQ